MLSAFLERHPKGETGRIERAYELAKKAHQDQVRRSGDPYISHPLSVARILAGLGLDDVTIAAALLHDAVEDTEVTLADISKDFGPDVAAIVDGVTKLDRLQFDTKEAQQAATLRKMLVAMAKDIRVLLIKLADRLHNMRTIAALPEGKQRRIAQETLDIYAPLAHRLGIQDVKWQLEDLSFAVLYPKRYAEIEQMVASRAPERDYYLREVLEAVGNRLAVLRIRADVSGRPKHFFSIYEKMVVKGKEFDEVQDLVAIRVVVDSVKDCYGALGSIHALWKPIQGRFKDYIAMPKFNLYQSLHTTVVGPQGKAVEVQIRTKEMHQRAEYGIAAHWGYKENRAPQEDLGWLQRLVDWQQETSDPTEFMEVLKVDLEQDEVFVCTPKGDVVTLPAGATAVDFAYTIHTEVGHRCIGARVNGRLVPLDSALASGDSVEIFTSKVAGAGPSRDWLRFVQTPRARSKIRQWFSRERRDDAIETGREELVKALRKEGLPVQKLAGSSILPKVAVAMNYADLDTLHAAIGEGHVSAKAVAQRIQREMRGGEEQISTTATRPRRKTRGAHNKIGVHVEGLDDVLVRLSRCCTPVPGDEIIGFVTRGRGVSVHRADCANAAGLTSQSSRLIEVEWDGESSGSWVVSIQIEALDRSKLLRDVAQVLADHHVDILSCSTHTTADRVATLHFDFELSDPGHLDSILAAVRRVDSIYEVSRVLPGKTLAH
ncbi:MAG TPA: bifunctional (p)ppGpp synthetase/guanosine-3',5'-bis(diphosphate) 3'-pyrophosphohydrolase [Acidimicrobiia bacterium]|nr:bifunctional (p)ppGpp synthetase/guanosine-3',5'-bis(diphosphate) 3'-pyrophosphohydrolase [Acidimicrobiia bacterium]